MNAQPEQEMSQQAGKVLGTVIVNGGGEQLLIPEEEMRAVETAGTTVCDTCGTRFEARKGTGGKPQRFCSPKCRATWHATAKEPPPETPVERAAPKPMPQPEIKDDNNEFNWSEADVIIPSQPAVAVYFNPRGDVVIRQEAQMHPDEDHFIFIHRQNLMPLIDKLCDIAGIPSAGGP